MGSLILHHIANPANANRRLHFYINSGGNAGLAAVCAARSLGYPCTVVLPVTSSPLMVRKIRAAGATQVVQYGETIAAAGEYMRGVLMAENTGVEDDVVRIALHPFDHEAIWEGNSTIVDELAEQLPPWDDDDDDDDEDNEHKVRRENNGELPVDAIVCSVGGGGLMNGLIQGIERQRKSTPPKRDIHILAVETDGTASLALALQKNALVTLPKVTSMAVSLACVRISQRTFDYCMSPPPGIAIHSVTLSDAEAARGCLRLADDERILVELACGVCVEAVVGDTPKLRGTKRKMISSHADEGYADEQTAAGKHRKANGHVSTSASADSALGSDEEYEIVSREQLSRLKEAIPDLTPDSRVVIIVCGGSNVTTGMASEWREKLDQGWV